MTGTPFVYDVSVSLGTHSYTFQLEVPHTTVGTIDLSAISSVIPPITPTSPYVRTLNGQSGDVALLVGNLSQGIVYLNPSAAATAGTAINAAIAALPTNGGTILLDGRDWTLDVAVSIDKSNVVIQGMGRATRLLVNGGVVSPAIKNADTTQRRVAIRDLAILNTNGSGTHVGTAIDASYFIESYFERLRIDLQSTTRFNKGIIFNSGTTFYDVVSDCRISCGGAGGQALAFDSGANSHVARNVRIIPDASSVGVFVNSTAIHLDHVDIETSGAVGIDVGASGHDCLITMPYLEANAINLRLAANVEAPTVIGGHINDATTVNIQDNGSRGLRIDNARVQFDPFSYKSSLNGGPMPRYLFGMHGGPMIPSLSQTATAGRVFMQLIEVQEGSVVDAIAFTNAGTVAGNVTVGIYGPVTKASEETDGSGLPVVVQSSSVATVGANASQFVSFTATYLRPGRYYAAVEFSDATQTFARHSGTFLDLVPGIGRHYDRAGGYGALTDPSPSAGQNQTSLPAVRLRCIALTSF